MDNHRSGTTRWRQWLCKIGWHHWRQDRPLRPIDAFPMDPKYETPVRICESCGAAEKWLPGYGGSEFGCWQRLKERVHAP